MMREMMDDIGENRGGVVAGGGELEKTDCETLEQYVDRDSVNEEKPLCLFSGGEEAGQMGKKFPPGEAVSDCENASDRSFSNHRISRGLRMQKNNSSSLLRNVARSSAQPNSTPPPPRLNSPQQGANLIGRKAISRSRRFSSPFSCSPDGRIHQSSSVPQMIDLFQSNKLTSVFPAQPPTTLNPPLSPPNGMRNNLDSFTPRGSRFGLKNISEAADYSTAEASFPLDTFSEFPESENYKMVSVSPRTANAHRRNKLYADNNDEPLCVLPGSTSRNPRMHTNNAKKRRKKSTWAWWRRKLFPKGDSLSLLLSIVGLLIASLGNSIFFKKMTDATSNYSWFISQVTTSVYLPIFGVVVIFSTINGAITSAMQKFPKERFAVMGLLDALSSILTIVGGAFTAGSTQVVLQQSMIPTTLFLTILLLGSRYHKLQYGGALFIVFGVLVVKLPDILNPDGPITHDVPIFNAIFLAATVPNALSQVYKEVAFRDMELDVNYMQLWVAIFQFFFGVAMVPLTTLHFLGAQRVAFKDIPIMTASGSKCLFLGIDFFTEHCGGPGQRKCDNCAVAWMPVTTYLAFNVAYNCFTLLVVKHGGATLSFLISAMRLPLASMAFYSKTIMGDEATNPKWTDFLGLLVLLTGLVFYRYGGMLHRKEESSPPCTMQLPFFATFLEPEPLFVRVHHVARSPEQIRSSYYWKLAVASPHESPYLRKRTLDDTPLATRLLQEYAGDDFMDFEVGYPHSDNENRPLYLPATTPPGNPPTIPQKFVTYSASAGPFVTSVSAFAAGKSFPSVPSHRRNDNDIPPGEK